MTYETTRSQELFAQAQRWLAGGVGSDSRSAHNGWVPGPIYVERGLGSRLWDVDGNEYIDYLMARGPLILGHRPAPVIEAVTRTLLDQGSLFALTHELEIEAARQVCEFVPSVERVRFDNSGTAVVQRAIRLARAYTGKTKIVRFEGHYHGWSDQMYWCYQPEPVMGDGHNLSRPSSNAHGVPELLAETVIVLPWNDPDRLVQVIETHKHDLACVITEPILGNLGGIMPRPGYLETMREVTAANDVLLIFDEVLTGFRVALGGAQQLLNIKPDLTTLAKAVAGGFPAAVLGGRAEIMELVAQARVIYGGTYNSSSLVTSAMVATMKQLSQPGFYEQLSLAGETLAQGLVELVRRVGLPATYSGVGPLFQLWFCEPDRLPRDYREARPILQRSPFHTFWQEMMARGVILHPQQSGLFLISAAHSLADIERTLDLAEAVMPAVKRAFEKMNG